MANLALPPQGRTFFNLKGPHWYENIDFELKVIRTQPHIQNVNERFFRFDARRASLTFTDLYSISFFQYAQNEHRGAVEFDGSAERAARYRIGIENDSVPERSTSWHKCCENFHFRFRIFVLISMCRVDAMVQFY